MACAGSTCVIVHKQQSMCGLCGKNVGGCDGPRNGLQKNYQKQVDPPQSPYKQIFPDNRWDEKKKSDKESKGCEKPHPVTICICTPLKSKKEEKDNKKEEKKDEKKEEKGVLSSTAMKASCLPMGGGGGGQCPEPIKMMLCLPCAPPGLDGKGPMPLSSGKHSKRPRDYTYRCESRELRGGNLYTCCQCNKRNGLQHDCPRTPCQGRPACLNKPWPDCWPSGGCHGIDFSRETGVKRYDPCREQRFDKKQCNAPAAKAKTNCGGNVMVIIPPKGAYHC